MPHPHPLPLPLTHTNTYTRAHMQIAGVSIMVAHWGMRLSKTVLAAMCAGHMVAYSAFHGLAFIQPVLPVLYTCLSSLWSTLSAIRRILEDPRYKNSISFSGIAVRLLTCEVPGLMLFMWAACSHKDSSSFSFSDLVPSFLGKVCERRVCLSVCLCLVSVFLCLSVCLSLVAGLGGKDVGSFTEPYF